MRGVAVSGYHYKEGPIFVNLSCWPSPRWKMIDSHHADNVCTGGHDEGSSGHKACIKVVNDIEPDASAVTDHGIIQCLRIRTVLIISRTIR